MIYELSDWIPTKCVCLSSPSSSLVPCTALPRSSSTMWRRSIRCLDPVSLWISPTAPAFAMRRRKWGSACLKVGHDKSKTVHLSSKRWNCLNGSNHRFKGKWSLKERHCNSVQWVLFPQPLVTILMNTWMQSSDWFRINAYKLLNCPLAYKVLQACWFCLL